MSSGFQSQYSLSRAVLVHVKRCRQCRVDSAGFVLLCGEADQMQQKERKASFPDDTRREARR